MKTSRLFWGFLFLTLGILFLVNNFAPMQWNWDAVWKLWPLVIILLGINMFYKDSRFRWVIGAVNGLLLALIIFSSFKGVGSFFCGNDECIDYRENEYTESWEPSVKTAELNIEAGAGKIMINGVTDSLIENTTKGIFSMCDFEKTDSDGHAKISMEMKHGEHHISKGLFNNEAKIKLNSNPVWDITMNIGAASFDADLTPFKIKNISTKCGASHLKYRIGDKSDTTNLDFETGASSLAVEVPKTSGCRITSESALSDKKFNDFKEVSDNVYETENFEKAEKKIVIHYKSGISTFSVKRY